MTDSGATRARIGRVLWFFGLVCLSLGVIGWFAMSSTAEGFTDGMVLGLLPGSMCAAFFWSLCYIASGKFWAPPESR